VILPLTALLVFAVLAGFSNAHCYPECFPNNPPSIAGLPDQTVMVGQSTPFWDLYTYASDTEDYYTDLMFSIDSQSNPGAINCYITGNRYVGCGAGQSTGYSDITVRVTDTGGLSSADTFRITVQSQPPPGDHAPVINSLRITPSSPEDTDTLTCTAQVSDQDGNLQSVQFRWLVDGGLDRTRTIQVSGSSSAVQDTLDSSRSGLGDEVECEAAAYDSTGLQDSDFDAVVIQRQDCGVDVLNLEVIDNNKIRFRIRNTGNSQQNINYKVYVDGGIIGESSVTLNSDELEIIQNSYSFGIGSFIVKVKATAQCGSTDSETIVHEVLNPCPETSSCPGPQPGNEDPVVDSVRITPSSPEEGDELTCRVELSDNEGDLDRMQIKWLVEGDLERTRTIYVSGSHDDVEDTLSSGWFNRGDDVRCEARVFDRDGNEDSDSDVVTIGGEQGCGVDVYNLEMISNNEIRFRIRNTGQDTESINYKVYVESEVIIEHAISLDEDEWDSIEETFSFDIGDSIVKVKAKADCGSTDTEFLSIDGDHGICQKKYLDEYRCSGSWSQRKYQYSDCSSLWVNYESCSSGCSNGFCIGTGGQCAVSIQKFDYQTSIVAGNAAYVTLEARNTASRQETITLSLWVDGQLKESYPSTVSTGSTSLRTFYYYPSAGVHQIQAKAETNCGTSDTRTATVNVLQTGQPSPYPYPYPTPPAPSLPTAVSIYPSSVDTCLCDAKFITINIHNSVEQVFTIQVTGIPSEWVSYQSQTIVKQGDRQLFVYAGPKELGTHNMRIKVTAETEKKSFEQDVSVFTAPCPEKPAATGDGITGSLIEAAKSPLFWIVLIIIAGAVVIFIGATRLKPDEEFYEPMYPYRTYRPVSKNQK